MNYSLAVTLLAITAAACTPKTPAASSSAVLPPERSWVIVAKPAQPAALDVTRIFQQRGYTLSDLRKDDRGVTLRFTGDRADAAEQVVTAADALIAVADVLDTIENTEESRQRRELRALTYQGPEIEHYDLGSVFYVRVEPRGETMTSIAVVGRPTRDGVEACTDDPIDAPCAQLESGKVVHPHIAGYAEADVIHGVFSELRLQGSVVAPDVEAIEQARKQTVSDQRCWEIRREREQLAAKISSAQARQNILRSRPKCRGSAPPADLARN